MMNPRAYWLALAGLVLASAAHAQTTALPEVPSTTQPNVTTPQGGIARGVIRPTRPVDSSMVKHPPTNAQHKMPVIRPPGTAR